MKLAKLLEKKGAHAVTVTTSDSVATAIRAMHEHRVGSVVIPSESGELRGILTERDIVHLYAEGKTDFEALAVADCMTTDLIIGHPGDSVDDVLTIMTQKRFRRLPVIQDDKIVGVISIGDLVKAKLEEAADEARALREYISS